MKGGPSRRLMIGLAFFLLDSNSIMTYFYKSVDVLHTPSSFETHNEEVVWLSVIDDDENHETCLGSYHSSFSSCSEVNAWSIHHIHGNEFTLEPYLESFESFPSMTPSEHLSIKREGFDNPSPILQLRNPSFFGGYRIWKYNSMDGMLSIDVFDSIDETMENFCISKESHSSSVLLKPCSEADFVPLEAVRFPTRSYGMQNKIDKLEMSGSYVDTYTHLHLPRSIPIDELGTRSWEAACISRQSLVWISRFSR